MKGLRWCCCESCWCHKFVLNSNFYHSFAIECFLKIIPFNLYGIGLSLLPHNLWNCEFNNCLIVVRKYSHNSMRVRFSTPNLNVQIGSNKFKTWKILKLFKIPLPSSFFVIRIFQQFSTLLDATAIYLY